VNPKNFFAELKRRNVYKVAIAYGVVAWLLMQIASQIFPFFEIPNWAVRLVVLVLILGFPVALIIAWAFELTPDGLKRTEVADEVPKKSGRSRAWIYVVVIGALLSIGVFFFGRYTANTGAPRQREAATASQKSIAVLPFENLSRDPDNAFFADGVQEEILTRLSKIGDLKVISRTSTQQFQSKPTNLSEIAKQLSVANILEGSVQRSADQVRVNVQLIKAATDAHLWADTFDRRVTDVFGVESEIAKAVADTLQARLSGAEQSAIAVRPTENSEAHELYLRGRYFFGKRGADNLKRAIDYFNQAIAKDPNYALAYAGIADTYAILSEYPHERRPNALNKARVATEKALALDNNLAEAHVSRGLLFVEDSNLKEARREFERAIALNPNYSVAHYFFGTDVLIPFGEFDRGIAEMKRAVELDPFSVIMNAFLGVSYTFARRHPEAIVQLRKAAELDPNFPLTHLGLGMALEYSGHSQEAIGEYQNAYELGQRGGENFDLILPEIDALKGERDKALQILDQLKALERDDKVPAFPFALDYATLGEKSRAIDWLERSYEKKEFHFLTDINVHPGLDSLHGDPRFEALVHKVLDGTGNVSPR